MTPTKKPRILVAAALPALLLMAATTGGAASADTISPKTLPTGKLPAVATDSSKAPDHIGATEKLAGFFPARPPAAEQQRSEERGYRYVYVFGTETEAKAYSSSGSAFNEEAAQSSNRACFVSGGSRSLQSSFYLYSEPKLKPGSPAALAELKRKASQREQERKAQEFEAARAKFLGVKPAVKPPANKSVVPVKPKTVRAVRTERFVTGADGKGSLEIVDAWLDLENLGIRLASRSSVPFQKVISGPSGISVFADRDDKQINFLVTPPEIPKGDPSSASNLKFLANRMVAQAPGETFFGGSSSECGYLRVSVHAEAGGGQMASVLATAFLPPAKDDDADTSDDDDEEARITGRTLRSVRTRPVLANLSVSQLNADSDPLVSVTFGWAGKEQPQRF